MATGQAEWEAESRPNREKLSPEDESILQQPYAQAVSFMGYRPDLIVYAAKTLQRQQEVITGEKICQTVENLIQLEKNGKPLPSLEECHVPERQRLGSDGDDDTDEAEYFDAQSQDMDDDIQTDGEQEPMRHHQIAEEVQVNEDNGPRREGDRAALQRKLMALREENRLLKARQKCRSCQNKPVSITFLPCGHYSYCYDCGHQFGACPICHKVILADVKTFLA